jgi:hypothetical protein
MEPVEDVDALRAVLRPLAERGLVVYLTPEGRRGTVLTHGFHPPEELERLRAAQPAEAASPSPAAPAPIRAAAPSPAAEEVATLRAEVADLRTAVAELTEQVRRIKEGLGM